MMNWAEEVAVKFLGDYFWTGESAKMAKADIIKALRKAKASGMREAANKLDDAPADSNFGLIANLIDELRRRASEIEKGNP